MATLTRTQVATRLGVAESTVRRLRDRGQLQATRNEEGIWLFDEDEVDAFVRRGDVARADVVRATPSEPRARPHPLSLRIGAWLGALGAGYEGALAVQVLHAKTGECVALEAFSPEEGEAGVAGERLAAVCEADADVRGGRTRYELVAEARGEEQGRLTVQVASSHPDEALTAAASLVPLNQQLMGYTERLTRLMLDQAERARATDRESFEQANRSLREQLKEARERIGHLERSAEDVARLREEALNEKAARELFTLQESNAERRKDAVVDKILNLLPVVAARFAGPGRANNAAGSSRAELLLGTLAQSVRPDQWVQMAEHLSDEQKVVFVELLDSFLQSEPERGRAPSSPPTSSDEG
jgi:excisionase family DNA binding protein